MKRWYVTAALLYSGHFEAESAEEAMQLARVNGFDDCEDTLTDFQAELDEDQDEEE